MDSTLEQAKRHNEALKHSLRALMDSNTERTREKPMTYFDELKEGVSNIRAGTYNPGRRHEKKSGDDVTSKAEVAQLQGYRRDEANGTERVATEPRESRTARDDTRSRAPDTVRARRDKQLLLGKVERQGMQIEELEAQVRRLQLQNRQLEASRAREHKVLEKDQRDKQDRLERLQRQEAQHRQDQQERHDDGHDELVLENVRLRAEVARLEQEGAAQHTRHQHLVGKVRTIVSIYKHQAAELRAQLRASLGVSSFCLLHGAIQECDDSTTQLIRGSPSQDDTMSLIRGTAELPRLGARSRLRARLLAVLFVVRVHRRAEANREWRLLVVF